MPVKKFRALDAAYDPMWLDPKDPRLVQRIKNLWAFSARLTRMRFPRGVHKHRSIGDAQAFLARTAEIKPVYGTPHAHRLDPK